MRELRHGTVDGYYSFKCKCDACRAASRAYRAELRSRPIPHGTATGYQNRGCRCEPCREAEAEARLGRGLVRCHVCGVRLRDHPMVADCYLVTVSR